MNMELKIKKLKENAKIPQRATNGSAGMDLYACIAESVTLAPGQLTVIPTGIAIELPDNTCAAFLYARSGLGVKHGICLSNGVGVIDSDYRGEVCVGLCHRTWRARVPDGDRAGAPAGDRRGGGALRHRPRRRRLWFKRKKIIYRFRQI